MTTQTIDVPAVLTEQSRRRRRGLAATLRVPADARVLMPYEREGHFPDAAAIYVAELFDNTALYEKLCGIPGVDPEAMMELLYAWRKQLTPYIEIP